MAEGAGTQDQRNQESKMNAILIGATGAIGRCLLGSLLQAKDKVAKVTVLSRRKVDGVAENYGVDLTVEEEGGRLVQHVEDLDAVSEENVKQLCTGGHVIFNCLGTTKAIAGSKENFVHIDYEIPLRLMKLAKTAEVGHCSIVTSQGANVDSWIFYLKTKGRMEASVREEQFEYTSVFRPGLLDRGEGNRRFVEKMSRLFVTSMKVSMVAEAMLQDAWTHHNTPGAASNTAPIFDNAAINRLCQEAAAATKK